MKYIVSALTVLGAVAAAVAGFLTYGASRKREGVKREQERQEKRVRETKDAIQEALMDSGVDDYDDAVARLRERQGGK